MAEPQAPMKAAEEPKEAVESEEVDEDSANPTFIVFVQLPNGEKIELPMGSTDTMMEVRQFLLDAPQSCWITSYSLHFNGQELDDATELSSLGPALSAKPVIMMKELPYNEHSARIHVRRLRELFESLQAPEKSPTVFTQLDTAEEPTEEERVAMVAEFEKPVSASLAKYYPATKAERPQPSSLLKSFAFSGWNPPPGNRRLQGDLFYLEVQTVESKHLFITASTSGFYVNQSSRTSFNPAPEKGAKKAHNLVDLLRAASSAFTKGFAALIQHEFTLAHPFEMLPVPSPVIPWAMRSKRPSYELTRLDDATLMPDQPGLVRDWNEEFQACFEQPKGDVRARIMRDRSLIKVVSEFLDAATRGAVAIVHKSVPPLNPMEPERTHMWMYSNIFFSSATDVREQYTKWGGEATAYKAVKIDLNGANRIFQLGSPDIRPVLTAVIDYRGHRLTAQAIIPGIMQNSQTEERVVYGSPDPGKPINVDAKFRDALGPVSKELHLAERTVKDPANGQNVTLHASSDSKGVMGADGRRYFLDLSRLMPRDANFKDDPRRLLAVHRFELLPQLDNYYTRLCDEELYAKMPASLALTDAEKRVVEQMRSTNPKLQEHTRESRKLLGRVAELSEAIGKGGATAEMQEEFKVLGEKLHTPSPHRIAYGFNSDLWGPAEVVASPEERAKQEDLLMAAGHFVKERLIRELISEWSVGFTSAPVDGQHLTTLMHRLGVPVRYLGEVATRAKKDLPYVTGIATVEMVARAAKHLFNATLKSVTDDSLLALTISHFLNALLGKREHEEKKKKTDAKAPAAAASAAAPEAPLPTRMCAPALTTPALWEAIAQVVKEEYGYAIAPADERANAPRLALLRSLCLKVGLQIAAREYDFAAEHPFSPTDVLELSPVAKTLQPRSTDGSAMLDEGRAYLTTGQLDLGFHNLTEALAIFHQVYGPMHSDTAACYSYLGQLLYHAGDTTQAAVHQRKAVIIYERVAGLDHFDTVAAYHQLAHFANTSNQLVPGLRFMYRAMSLSALVSGAKHPEHVQNITTAALMLHECGATSLALRYLQEALRLTEETQPDGPMSEHTAAVCHMLAFIYGANGDFKEALTYEKRTYYIYREKLGEANQRTQDANTWLKQFTAQAVQNRRESTKQAEEFVAAAWQDPRVRRFVQNQLGASLGTGRPSPAEVSRILSKLGNTPEALARLMQRGASALAATDPAGAAAKGPAGKAPAGISAADKTRRMPRKPRK